MIEPKLRLWVPGRSRTKGSLKSINRRGAKPVLVEDLALSKPWRNTIIRKVREAYPRIQPALGAVRVDASFWFAQEGPTAQTMTHPMVNAGVNANGDLDKLVRNLLDALQDAKVFMNDSQVCSLAARKGWAVSPERVGLMAVVEEL